MSQPILLQDRFTGMYQDKSRDELPKGKVWDMTDYIPDTLGASLRKRGGWTAVTPKLYTINNTAAAVAQVIWAPFTAGSQIVAVDQNGDLFDVTNSTKRGAAVLPTAPMIFYRNLVLVAKAAGDAVPMKYSGSGAPANIGGSPPNARILAIHRDRVLAARASATPNRIYFSAAANAESWDTTNAWIDTSAPIEGLVSLQSMFLVFHGGSVERVRGAIPPGSPATDMKLEPLFDDVGLIEPNSLVVHGETCYFAHSSGVYSTDGSAVQDLTRQGGISRYWRSLITAGSLTYCALGYYRGHLLVSVREYGNYIDFLMYDIKNQSWFRHKRLRALNFSPRIEARPGTSPTAVSDKLYISAPGTVNPGGSGDATYVGELSTIFDPSSSTKNDPDNSSGSATPIEPVVELPYYNVGATSKKRVKHIYVTHDIRDAATDNPILTLSYARTPEATSYTTMSPTLPETTETSRKRIPVGTSPAYGVSLKIAQTNASSDTRIQRIEADVHSLEGSKR